MFVAGIDIGSLTAKTVILDEQARVLGVSLVSTGAVSQRAGETSYKMALMKAGIPSSDVAYVLATGYGRNNIPFAKAEMTEITCHAKGAHHLFPEARTIIDIGGQDVKAMKIDPTGRATDFVMNDKCAAGSGRFIEVIADSLGVPLDQVGDLSLQSAHPARISNICTIWAQQEVAASLAQGIPISDLLAGVHQSLADRISRMVHRIKVEDAVIVTGGGGKNKGLLKALSEQLGHEISVPEEPLITGALGAALLGREIVEQARQHHIPIKTKERILEEIEIL
jgi:(R)-2-hydroxyacyl-CoA dehydratese activating ATPase